jgi:hypothetical protein
MVDLELESISINWTRIDHARASPDKVRVTVMCYAQRTGSMLHTGPVLTTIEKGPRPWLTKS